MPLKSVGQRVDDFIRKPLPRLQRPGQQACRPVLRIDKFGNVITNRPSSGCRAGIHNSRGRQSRSTASVQTLLRPSSGELFAIEGSTGYIEIALNQGSAAERLHIQRGDEIEVETRTANH